MVVNRQCPPIFSFLSTDQNSLERQSNDLHSMVHKRSWQDESYMCVFQKPARPDDSGKTKDLFAKAYISCRSF